MQFRISHLFLFVILRVT